MQTSKRVSRPHLPEHHDLLCANRYARLISEPQAFVEEVEALSVEQPTLNPLNARFEFRKDIVQWSLRISLDPIVALVDATAEFLWPAGTIPFGYRPPVNSQFLVPLINGGVATHGFLSLNTDGSIALSVTGNWILPIELPGASIIYQV